MMKHKLLVILLAVTLPIMAGCGMPKVSGKVTFPDGAPLTTGTIFFEADQHTYQATIHRDGSFNMGVLRDGEGIPPGTYRVFVQAVSQESMAAHDENPDAPLVYLTDRKYASPRTSDIVYTIESTTRNISIVVSPPAE